MHFWLSQHQDQRTYTIKLLILLVIAATALPIAALNHCAAHDPPVIAGGWVNLILFSIQ